MKLTDIKPNPDNPRVIKDDKFKKLCNSIQDFPKMMELRPIVIDADNVVLGGNMRLKALQSLGFKDIPDSWVKRAQDLTEEEKSVSLLPTMQDLENGTMMCSQIFGTLMTSCSGVWMCLFLMQQNPKKKLKKRSPLFVRIVVKKYLINNRLTTV